MGFNFFPPGSVFGVASEEFMCANESFLVSHFDCNFSSFKSKASSHKRPRNLENGRHWKRGQKVALIAANSSKPCHKVFMQFSAFSQVIKVFPSLLMRNLSSEWARTKQASYLNRNCFINALRRPSREIGKIFSLLSITDKKIVDEVFFSAPRGNCIATAWRWIMEINNYRFLGSDGSCLAIIKARKIPWNNRSARVIDHRIV